MKSTRITVAALLLVACGGDAKPPATPQPAPSASASTTSVDGNGGSTAPGPKMDGPSAPASGDEVKNGIVALKKGDINGARSAFEVAVKKNPQKADGHYYLGLVDDQTGQKAEAEKEYRKAIELQSDLDEASLNLAALLVDAGKFDEAATLMRKLTAKNPKNTAAHVNLAMALAGKNDVPGASKELDEALKIEPNNGANIVTYASMLAKAGKKDDAVAKLKQAEKIAATDPGVLASIALEYKGMKDFKTCVATLDKAIGQKDIAELRIYRGACKLGLKDLAGATTEFKDAVAKEPNNALAHYSLGNAYGDGKKYPEAIAEWETYLKLEPDGPQAKAAQRKIEIAKKK